MTNNESLKDFKPFFGGDDKGPTFVQALFSGSNYTQSSHSGFLEEILRADNYKNFKGNRAGVSAQGPDDVHQDISDLIINTALFHRSIDKPTVTGTNAGDVLDAITNSLKSFVNASNNEAQTECNSLTNEFDPINSKIQTGSKIGKLYGQQNIKDVIVYSLVDFAVVDTKTSQAGLKAYPLTETNKLDADIKAISGEGTANTLEWVNYAFNVLIKGPAAERFIGQTGYKPTEYKATKTQEEKNLKKNLQDILVGAIKTVIVGIKTKLNNLYPSIKDNVNAGTVQSQAKFNSEILTSLSKAIDDESSKFVRGKFSPLTGDHQTLDNPDAKKFFDEVYTKWGNMSEDFRQFYTQNIAIFSMGPLEVPWDDRKNQTRLLDRWHRLTQSEMDKLLSSKNVLSQSEYRNYRLNLMKNPNNLQQVLFSSNLPDVPSGSNVWYTQKDGNLGRVRPGKDFLRNLYDSVYAFGLDSGTVTVLDRDDRAKGTFSNFESGQTLASSEDTKAIDKKTADDAREAADNKKANELKAMQRTLDSSKQQITELTRLVKEIGSSSKTSTDSEMKETPQAPHKETSHLEQTSTEGKTNQEQEKEKEKDQEGGSRFGRNKYSKFMFGGGIPYTLVNLEGVLANRQQSLMGPLNLDHGKFIAAAIAREEELAKEQVKVTVSPPASPDDLSKYPFLRAYDMVYGQIWSYDSQKQQYYRYDDNGKQVWYDKQAMGDAKTCYATYLGAKDAGKCKRVMDCIFDGDSRSLNLCLDVLSETDLWEVAAQDARIVGPDKIKLVLKKFGVKGYEETDSSGVKYVVPMSYDEWLKDIVSAFPANVKDTIERNESLKTYIRGLIAVLRANPNILNKNVPSIVLRDTTPDYVKNLNMKKYKLPTVTKKSKYEFFAESLRNAMMPVGVSQSWFNPITSGQFSNATFFNPMSIGASPLLGGNPFGVVTPSLATRGTGFYAVGALDRDMNVRDSSATQFENLLATINNAFTDVGLQLHPEDKSRIESVISKMKQYETDLARIYSVLITIVKTARLYGVSLENVDKERPKTVQLSKFSTYEDITDFIRDYARTLTKNMLTNMTVQQAASFELMNRVYPRLIDECAEKAKDSEPSSTRKQVELWGRSK